MPAAQCVTGAGGAGRHGSGRRRAARERAAHSLTGTARGGARVAGGMQGREIVDVARLIAHEATICYKWGRNKKTVRKRNR